MRATHRDHGSALIAVLLTLTILMILGMAFLSQKSAQYETAVRGRRTVQARAIAQAGLVDFRTKVAKDKAFPPARPEGTEAYHYSEELLDLDGKAYGGYSVRVDMSKNVRPFWVAQVSSQGFLGSRSEPTASYSLYAEMDFSEDDRTNPSLPNPNLRQWILYQEGSLPTTKSVP